VARKFALEIVTPERVFLSQEVESLIVPAEKGYLGVLAGHAPLLATLRPGEITYRLEDGEVHAATGGGFMEVMPRKTILLTESVEDPAHIDVARAEQARERARKRLASADRSVDRRRAQVALERAENRLRLASKYKK
jgi:F-type H+-transporting ATPase subunit epsilon